MNASVTALRAQAVPPSTTRRRATPLPSPTDLRQRLPLSAALASQVQTQREAIRAVLDGSDPRLLVVVGPCSLHDPISALEYADRLAALARTHGFRDIRRATSARPHDLLAAINIA